MKHTRILALVLAAAAASHALGDRTVFDTTHAPPPPNPRKGAPFVVGLELGANSLASVLGGRLTWYPFQNIALDAGGSWSQSGLRGGFGARYFLSDSFSSPFVGVAWKRSAGVDSASLDDGKSTASQVTINSIQWVDAQVGYEIRNSDGLVVIFTTGWSFAITPEADRWKKVSGDVSKDASDNLSLYTGSGPIGAISVGFGF